MGIASTVLFAEDETSIRDSVAQLLSMDGFRVLKAEDGYEALRLLTQEDVDLLFTDIVMPELDGIELARKARQIRPNVKIMFITGYSAKASEALQWAEFSISPCAETRSNRSCGASCKLLHRHSPCGGARSRPIVGARLIGKSRIPYQSRRSAAFLA